MIIIKDINQSEPYKRFINFLNKAKEMNQKPINAISISSYDKEESFVDARFVNLKYIIDEDWIFFSNYDGPKMKQFRSHNQICILIYWEAINLQIRMRATIKKCSEKFSDEHFLSRTKEKNALAISSKQSQKIKDYEDVKKKYKKTLHKDLNLFDRPSNWGGYSFKPYYFEFWEGHKSRLNKRNVYEKVDDIWSHFILEP